MCAYGRLLPLQQAILPAPYLAEDVLPPLCHRHLPTRDPANTIYRFLLCLRVSCQTLGECKFGYVFSTGRTLLYLGLRASVNPCTLDI